MASASQKRRLSSSSRRRFSARSVPAATYTSPWPMPSRHSPTAFSRPASGTASARPTVMPRSRETRRPFRPYSAPAGSHTFRVVPPTSCVSWGKPRSRVGSSGPSSSSSHSASAGCACFFSCEVRRTRVPPPRTKCSRAATSSSLTGRASGAGMTRVRVPGGRASRESRWASTGAPPSRRYRYNARSPSGPGLSTEGTVDSGGACWTASPSAAASAMSTPKSRAVRTFFTRAPQGVRGAAVPRLPRSGRPPRWARGTANRRSGRTSASAAPPPGRGRGVPRGWAARRRAPGSSSPGPGAPAAAPPGWRAGPAAPGGWPPADPRRGLSGRAEGARGEGRVRAERGPGRPPGRSPERPSSRAAAAAGPRGWPPVPVPASPPGWPRRSSGLLGIGRSRPARTPTHAARAGSGPCCGGGPVRTRDGRGWPGAGPAGSRGEVPGGPPRPGAHTLPGSGRPPCWPMCRGARPRRGAGACLPSAPRVPSRAGPVRPAGSGRLLRGAARPPAGPSRGARPGAGAG
ncbi:hypothetical protein STIAU_5108 [Stigmatella aurantiaca DW4/3-1]|uniref:Uncharacterized protein n=1 Tax=Stigmatella aurantiaca (strain DW4/3-1) TaxID=378806 RepID=Q097Z5_STIAD|nr:hypothetical protein STIAU_5108 [Stigmatella aurantiaca DW4/3-1]